MSDVIFKQIYESQQLALRMRYHLDSILAKKVDVDYMELTQSKRKIDAFVCTWGTKTMSGKAGVETKPPEEPSLWTADW